MQNAFRIVVVEQDHDRAIAIMDALKDACECDVLVIANADSLARQIVVFQPDIVLIDIDAMKRSS